MRGSQARIKVREEVPGWIGGGNFRARRQGGFDLIIGNPPYRREKDAKEQFEEIAGTPLGKKWRQARMDLWYYFLHRSLDLLHPMGLLCFVVNSYWTHSRGARNSSGGCGLRRICCKLSISISGRCLLTCKGGIMCSGSEEANR
ncbi:MAG: Eco57I restriction-modification methylase domain-containing protein [Planctomycetales bacterium]